MARVDFARVCYFYHSVTRVSEELARVICTCISGVFRCNSDGEFLEIDFK